MRKATLVAGCVTVCVVALFAVDEQRLNVKPGVWQVELKVKYSGLPPQYQAMMDQMTAQQKSAMGIAAPKTYKMCLREKDLNKGWTQGDNNSKCPWQVVKSTSSDLELHSPACKAGDSEIDLKFHAVNPEHVQATLHGTATEQGTKINFDGNYTATWMGATCPADMDK